MEREERQNLKGVVDEVSGWHKRAAALIKERQAITAAAEAGAAALLGRSIPLTVGGATFWHVLQLTPSDGDHVTALARGTALPAMPPLAQQGIDQLTTDADRALGDVKPLFGARRMFSGKSRKDTAAQAATYLVSLRDWSPNQAQSENSKQSRPGIRSPSRISVPRRSSMTPLASRSWQWRASNSSRVTRWTQPRMPSL